MQIINLLTSKSKTIQANATVTAMVSASGLIKVTTSAAHGLETGDITQISGVIGTIEANGQWIVTVIDATNFTLGNSIFRTAYVSGGTVQHCGWSTALTAFNQNFFVNTPLNLVGKVLLQSAPANSTLRFVIDDAALGDSAFITAMPGPTFSYAGGQSTKSDGLQSFSFMSDFSDLRLQIENSWRLRVLFGKPVIGGTYVFSSWFEVL